MLRLIVVSAIVVVGVWYSLRSPFYALLFYLWNAYFRPEFWLWDNEIFSSLNLSYSVGVLVVGAALLGRWKKPFNLHLGLILVFVAHAFVSTWLSAYEQYAFPFLVEFAKVLAVTYAMVVLVDDAVKLRLLILILALSVGFEGAKQGFAELILHPGAQNQNALPHLGDNNGVAIGMLMLVPPFAALAETTDRLWPRRLYRFLLVGVLYRAITTYSRGGFLGAAALASLWGLRSPRKLRALTGMALIAAIIAPVLPGAFWDRMGTISKATEVGDVSALGRLHFWDVARAMADAHPVVGVGFNAYNAAYDDYDFSHGQYGGERSVHSAWFGVLAELGYVGLTLYLAIVLLAFRNCWQATRVEGSASLQELRLYSTALAVSFGVFVVGATFLPSQYSEMAWHYIGLTMVIRRLAIDQVALASSNTEEGDRLPEDHYSSISAANTVYGLPS